MVLLWHKNSSIFLTQLEAPKEVVFYAFKKAHQHGVTNILNPAPAATIDKDIFPIIDYFTPNEIEAILIYLNKDLLPTTEVIGQLLALKFLAGQYFLP